MNPKPCECEHEFTLVLSGISELTSAIEDAFYESGCTDATIAVRSGRLFITFSRTATSVKDAILGAIMDVRRANVGADVLRVDSSNLVTQADIARKIGRSRQLVHQYLTGKRGPGSFPGPVCEITDGAPLWLWSEVACWLWENDMITEGVLRDAQEIDVINSALEMRHQRRTKPQLTEEIVRLVEA